MIRIGVICPSEIAFRRFMPALMDSPAFSFAGLGVYTAEERFGKTMPDSGLVDQTLAREYEKARQFTEAFGGKIFEGYKTIAVSDEIDALYVPLPPALHFPWARLALENGKHVMVEKPSATSSAEAGILTSIAASGDLALHENYMFTFHRQLDAIRDVVASGEIGDVRLYRVSFGFPRRAANDFRYKKELGGGALFDAGGYTIRYASMLLGESARIACARLNYTDGFDVDLYGSGVLVNDEGTTVQIAFGMDNHYKCELEVWGSKGCLTTGRVLTAPAGFVPEMTIRKGNDDEARALPADDAFRKSLEHFRLCIADRDRRRKTYRDIEKQAKLVDDFRKMAGD